MFTPEAAAAFLGRAGLVVDQHRHALHLAQLALHGIELVAVVDGGALGEIIAAGVFLRLVGDDCEAFDALGAHLARNHVDGEVAFMRLPAGHCHGVVEQDLVGHVHAGRDPGADREITGMVISAIADILEHVSAV